MPKGKRGKKGKGSKAGGIAGLVVFGLFLAVFGTGLILSWRKTGKVTWTYLLTVNGKHTLLARTYKRGSKGGNASYLAAIDVDNGQLVAGRKVASRASSLACIAGGRIWLKGGSRMYGYDLLTLEEIFDYDDLKEAIEQVNAQIRKIVGSVVCLPGRNRLHVTDSQGRGWKVDPSSLKAARSAVDRARSSTVRVASGSRGAYRARTASGLTVRLSRGLRRELEVDGAPAGKSVFIRGRIVPYAGTRRALQIGGKGAGVIIAHRSDITRKSRLRLSRVGFDGKVYWTLPLASFEVGDADRLHAIYALGKKLLLLVAKPRYSSRLFGPAKSNVAAAIDITTGRPRWVVAF